MAVKDYLPKAKWFANWAVPIDASIPTDSRLEEIVDRVVANDKNVRNVFEQSPGKEAGLKKQLGYIIQDSYHENRNLRRMSQYIDTMDKALIPFDVLADSLSLFGGPLGISLSAGKELIEMAPKLAYMTYYTSKTKDFVGAVGNLFYEGLSWFLPGSLLDLTNRYVKQAEKYLLKDAADRFLGKVDLKKPAEAPANLKPSLA